MKRLLGLLFLLPLASVAQTNIPESIQPPANFFAFMTAHAKGDQIYQCQLNQSVYSWQLLAPDAQLFDDQGMIIGKHYFGPVWEYKEGSRLQGKQVAKHQQLVTAIPWLLIEVVSHQGESLFAQARFINRINTQGGLAPTTLCNGNHLGSEKRVNYSADYIFYRSF